MPALVYNLSEPADQRGYGWRKPIYTGDPSYLDGVVKDAIKANPGLTGMITLLVVWPDEECMIVPVTVTPPRYPEVHIHDGFKDTVQL